MSVMNRIDSLKNKHTALEGKIMQEETRPHPDEDLLHTLKREKLRIKDEIRSLVH